MPAAPSPELALRAAKATAELYGEAVDTLLAQVAARLNRGITEPGWAEQKLAETRILRDEARAVVARLDAATPAAVRAAITTGHQAGLAAAAKDLTGAELRTALAARTNTRAVDALVHETITGLRSTHVQILRSTADTYRAIIAETAAPAVVTGTRTRLQATQQALDRFAARGVTGFVDQAGKRWSLDSYAEMATRTATGRAQVAGTLDRFTAAGRDLVIVSDAPQECSVCRPWEGKILSIAGATPGYPTVAEAQAAGLHHANCRHRLDAYIPGLTRASDPTADPTGDANRQEQRRLERGVRSWKRRELVALDDRARKLAVAKQREWQARLRTHVDANDLKRLPYREQVRA